MTMWKLKSCPRCRGDIFIEKDLNGWFEQCLQCSYRHEVRDAGDLNEQPVQEERRTPVAGGLKNGE